MRRVVVTGMGIISPIGNTIEEYWRNLHAGICGVGRISRYDAANSPVKLAAEVKNFHPEKYMEPGEIRRTDLYAQYAIAAGAQAMADSGLKGSVAPERLGVYFGSGIGGTATYLAEAEKLLTRGGSRVSPYCIPMIISNMAAGLLAIRHKARGPCLPVVTACATSSHAIGEAYRCILGGYADAVLAGGAEAGINPLIMAGFTNCNTLSLRTEPEEGSLPFDRRRDGFVMGEGAGALVLEEWESAYRRGAHIYAELVGYGNTCDAYHMTAPQPEAVSSARAIAMAMDGLSPPPCSRIYFNAHGTGTPVNDVVETLAIKRVFGRGAHELYISSTKSMTGHMMGAAGAAEAISAIMALYSGVVAPTAGYRERDPACDLHYVPGRAVRADIRLALSLSLGFGGHNACLAFRRIEK